MDLVAELRRILPGEDGVRADGGEVERHGSSVFTYHDPRPPDAVVYPRGRDEVAALLSFCNEHGVPSFPSGRGAAWRGRRSRRRAASAWTSPGWTRFSRSAPTISWPGCSLA
jgi:FAD/FMN-containing dehydrogenase